MGLHLYRHRYGITEHELRIAQREVVNRLLQYNKSLMSAFRSMDSDHSGVLYREEVTGRAIPAQFCAQFWRNFTRNSGRNSLASLPPLQVLDFIALASGYAQSGDQAYTEGVNIGGVPDAAVDCLLHHNHGGLHLFEQPVGPRVRRQKVIQDAVFS